MTRRPESAHAGQFVTLYLSLLAAVLVPLYFNTWADRSFDQQKNLLLIALATLVCAVMAMSAADSARYRSRLLALTYRLEVRVLLLALVAQIFSSVLSIAPLQSVLGSYDRMQGLFTFTAGTTICLAIASVPSSLATLNRFALAITLTSVPIAGYALIQHWGLDPLSWRDNVELRSTSHLGNPVHLGAWLMLAIPFTAGLLCCLLAERAEQPVSSNEKKHTVFRATALFAILLLQLLALYWTYSRGPLLGLACAFALSVIAWLVQQHQRGKLVRALTAVMVFAVLGIVLLTTQMAAFIDNSRPPPSSTQAFEMAADKPVKSTHWTDLPSYAQSLDSSSQARLLIWESAVAALSGHSPLKQGIDPDRVEYGNSPLRLLFGFGPETNALVLSQFRSLDWNRVENSALTTDRAHNLTWDSLITTGVVGAVAQHLLYYVLFCTLIQSLGFNRTERQRLLTSLAWWLTGTAIAALALTTNNAALAPPLFVAGSLAGGGLAVLLQLKCRTAATGANHQHRIYALVLLGVLIAHLVEAQFGVGGAASQLYLFIIAGLVLQLDRREEATSSRAGSPTTLLIAAGAVALANCYLQPGTLQHLGVTGEYMTLSVYVALLCLTGMAWLTSDKSPNPKPDERPTRTSWLVPATLLTLACVFIWKLPLAMARANTLYHPSADTSLQHPLEHTKLALLRATALSPAEPVYQTALAQSSLQTLAQLQSNNTLDARNAVLQPLERAIELQPWSATFMANKARAHIVIANQSKRPEQRSTNLQQAAVLFDRARTMHPHDSSLLNSFVSVQFQISPNCKIALANLEYSQTLQPALRQTQRLKGDVAQACISQNPYNFGKVLVHALEHETRLSTSGSANSTQSQRWLRAAQLLQDHQQHKLALESLNAALELATDIPARWQLNVRKVDSLRLNNKPHQARVLATELLANAPTNAPLVMHDFLKQVLAD